VLGLVVVVLWTMVLAACSSESSTESTTSRPSTEPTPTSPTSPNASLGGTTKITREAWLWPFAADSPWNAGVGSGAVLEAPSAPLTSALINPAVKVWVNSSSYSHPIYRASDSDPMATVRQRGRPDVQYRIPDAAVPAEGTDRHLHVVDPSGRWLNETWSMRGANPTWTAGYYQRVDLHGSGFGAGTRASGASGAGGLIRAWELNAGDIRHALAIAISSAQLSTGIAWPATRTDGNASSNFGRVPMGTYAAIPPTVDLVALGLTPEGQAVGRAMQGYGVYVVDRSSVFALYTEPSVDGAVLTKLRADVDTLRRYLRVVTNNGPGTVNGGGSRSVPAAPTFAS
jgi:hypothetical protein